MDRRTEIAFAIATLATGVRAVVHGAICLSSYFLSALPYLSVLVSLAVEDQRRRIDKRMGSQCQ